MNDKNPTEAKSKYLFSAAGEKVIAHQINKLFWNCPHCGPIPDKEVTVDETHKECGSKCHYE